MQMPLGIVFGETHTWQASSCDAFRRSCGNQWRCLVPRRAKPAVADFLDFFTRDRTTILVVAAFVIIPAMDKHQRDYRLSVKGRGASEDRCKRRCGELQCHEISLRENCRKYRLGADHCIMFSTTSLNRFLC